MIYLLNQIGLGKDRLNEKENYNAEQPQCNIGVQGICR